MNILSITTLYPAFKNESKDRITYAIHYMNRSLNKDNNVRVIVPKHYYGRIFRFKEDYEIRKIYNQKEVFYQDDVKVLSVGVRKLPKYKFYKGDMIKLKKISLEYLINEEFRPDIIICNLIEMSLELAVYLKRIFNSKLVFCAHVTDKITIEKKNYLYREFLKYRNEIDIFAYRSESIKNSIDGLVNIRNKKNIIMLSGIEKDIIIDNVMLEKKIKKKSQVITIVARLVPYKKVDLLIKAVANLKDKYDLELNIIGTGPLEEELKELSNKLKMTNVNFMGFMEHKQVIKELKKADIFAMISSPETLGLVYIEAMSQGCIVIGSKGEGIDGIIKDKVNGFLCEPNNLSQLIIILENIINMNEENKNKILRESMLTVNNLTQDNVAKNYLKEILND